MQAEKANILLVDDQPANLLALEAILEGLGQNLVQAHSGTDALRRLLHDDFALILMDVQMPDLDGLETADLIRQRDRSRHTPIIFLTAHDRTDVQMFRGYSLGAVDYLIKPIVPEILRSKAAVFVELFQMTEQVKRQARLLAENQHREHERRLAEEKQHWEMERLRQEAAREKEANHRKDEFLAMLAHELRNPLAPMFNALHILRQPHCTPEGAEAARDVLDRQVRQMTRLVDDLLDVSRITSGKIQLRKEAVELAAVVGRVVESTRPLVEGRGHRLDMELPPEPIRLEADPTRLEQVLANLVNNAAKYTEPGGRISLHAKRHGDDVILRVRDNGIGIPPELLPRIFEPFMQADRALDRSHGGLGLGLTLVQRLVELHGGSVQAHSAGSGQGSEFVVRLPAPREFASAAGEAAPRLERSNGHPCRVLVIEDNKDTAESLALLLRLDGHDVCLAHDGQSAVVAARTYRPEVILLDIGLPGMDGYEVARQLYEQGNMDDVMLVAMTGYGQAEDRRRSQDAGFNHHLVKPVDPIALEELLARAPLCAR
ncbi:MAG TPA: response regulator [Gemmataceae bacterium]|jgi:signal transduction histidine kinase|nr:response regulator [Gemmataceae bacterium]